MRPRVRQRILEFVAGHGNASTSAIARRLGMSPAAVRHHLLILRSDGRLVGAEAGRRGNRGRPENAYRLSEMMLGNNLAMVCDVLLSVVQAGASDQTRKSTIEGPLADKLLESIGQARSGLSPAGRVAVLVSRLRELSYAASWEAGAQGPRVVLGHCPYAAVIRKHPQLCEMDRRAIAAWMGTTATQVAKINTAGGDASRCVFSLK
ncbi:MAG TPA: helix-turn-helix domain-containing protein [Anaerolineales bacterium]